MAAPKPALRAAERPGSRGARACGPGGRPRRRGHDLLRPVDVAVDDHDGLPVADGSGAAATPAAAAAGARHRGSAPPRTRVVTTPPGRGRARGPRGGRDGGVGRRRGVTSAASGPGRPRRQEPGRRRERRPARGRRSAASPARATQGCGRPDDLGERAGVADDDRDARRHRLGDAQAERLRSHAGDDGDVDGVEELLAGDPAAPVGGDRRRGPATTAAAGRRGRTGRRRPPAADGGRRRRLASAAPPRRGRRRPCPGRAAPGSRGPVDPRPAAAAGPGPDRSSWAALGCRAADRGQERGGHQHGQRADAGRPRRAPAAPALWQLVEVHDPVGVSRRGERREQAVAPQHPGAGPVPPAEPAGVVGAVCVRRGPRRPGRGPRGLRRSRRGWPARPRSRRDRGRARPRRSAAASPRPHPSRPGWRPG